MDQTMLAAAVATYAKVAQVTSGLALAIFTARISLSATLISQPGQYGSIVKELILFFLAIALFPEVFRAIVVTSGSVAHMLSYQEVARGEGTVNKLWDLVVHDYPFLSMAALGPWFTFHLVRGIYLAILGAICAIAPVVLLYQFLSGQGAGVAVLGQAVLTLSSWPILWNSLGLLSNQFWPSFSKTSLAGVCFSLAITVLQVLSPFFAAAFFKTLSVSGASKSAKAITVIKKVVLKA
jgi:hypothetical protein